MTVVDVAIIGGGPAGCSTALALRAKGYRVALISKAARGRPTETATPMLPQVLRAIGADAAMAACEPCLGIESNWGAAGTRHAPSIASPFGHGWFVHRDRFDAALRTMALASGVTSVVGKASSVEVTDSQATVVVDGAPITAKWVALATGSPRSFGVSTSQRVITEDRLLAFWARLPSRADERWLRLETADYGWWYRCPNDGPGSIACLVTDQMTARSLSALDAREWCRLWESTRLGSVVTERPTIGVAPIDFAWAEQVHGARWIAVGDAAAKLDPIGSAGTTTALDAGHRAAAAVDGALQGRTNPFTAYERWYRGLVREFVARRQSHYDAEINRRDGEFWAHRRLNRRAAG